MPKKTIKDLRLAVKKDDWDLLHSVLIENDALITAALTDHPDTEFVKELVLLLAYVDDVDEYDQVLASIRLLEQGAGADLRETCIYTLTRTGECEDLERVLSYLRGINEESTSLGKSMIVGNMMLFDDACEDRIIDYLVEEIGRLPDETLLYTLLQTLIKIDPDVGASMYERKRSEIKDDHSHKVLAALIRNRGEIYE